MKEKKQNKGRSYEARGGGGNKATRKRAKASLRGGQQTEVRAATTKWKYEATKEEGATKRRQPTRGNQAAKRQETSSRSKIESTRFGEKQET